MATIDKYPLEMDKETMRELMRALDWLSEHSPFTPENLRHLREDIYCALTNGCFKHKCLCTVFHTCVGRTEIVCPDCDPKRWKELKDKKGVTIEEV